MPASTSPMQKTDSAIPQAQEAEKRVLGAMFRDNTAIAKASDILQPDSFYDARHQKIFTALVDLARENTATDPVTVYDRLNGSIDHYYLVEIINSVATSVNVEHHAKIIQEKSIRRQAIRNAHEQIKNAESEDLDVLAAKAYQDALQIAPPSRIAGFRRIDSFLDRSIDQIQERMNRKRSGKPFKDLLTGIHDFDYRFGGFSKGELVILAARPSEGKTLLATQIAMNAACTGNVGYVSLEMAGEEILNRSFSTIKGSDDKTTASLILQNAGELQKRNLYFDDSPGIRIDQLAARSERLKLEIGELDLLVIDYLQLLRTPPDLNRFPRIEKITFLSGECKALARRLNCPVLLLSQLSRECEKESRKPRLSDLRESGSIEQDADMVIFIHRPGGVDRGTSGTRELRVEKNRNGSCGKLDVIFSVESLAFYGLSDREYSEGERPF